MVYTTQILQIIDLIHKLQNEYHFNEPLARISQKMSLTRQREEGESIPLQFTNISCHRARVHERIHFPPMTKVTSRSGALLRNMASPSSPKAEGHRKR